MMTRLNYRNRTIVEGNSRIRHDKWRPTPTAVRSTAGRLGKMFVFWKSVYGFMIVYFFVHIWGMDNIIQIMSWLYVVVKKLLCHDTTFHCLLIFRYMPWVPWVWISTKKYDNDKLCPGFFSSYLALPKEIKNLTLSLWFATVSIFHLAWMSLFRQISTRLIANFQYLIDRHRRRR